MSTFDEQLDAAEKDREYIDVPVLLVAELIAEKDRLEAIIAADDGDERLGAASAADEAREALDALNERAGEGLRTLRFVQLPGDAWTDITVKHLPRPGVSVDEMYGYNFKAVTDEAALYVDPSTGEAFGFHLEGDEKIPLTADRFAKILRRSGHEVKNIRNSIWGLNEWFPKQKIEAAGKALGAAARSEKN